MFLHTGRGQKVVQHKLDLLLVGGLPEDEWEFGVFVDPLREPILAMIFDPFVEDIVISVSLVVISWIIGVGCSRLQEHVGFGNFPTDLGAFWRPLPKANSIIFEDEGVRACPQKQVVGIFRHHISQSG